MLKKPVLPGAHWWMLALTGVLFALVATLVDLKPVVDQNFFFSTTDPGVRQSKKIEQHFPSQPEIILAVSSRNISSARYLGRIQKLTQQLQNIEAVSAVKSLTAGPKSFEDALKSPFWSRLLIARDRKSSNVIVFVEGKETEKLIKRIEGIMHELDEKDFRIHIAGPPYVIEMIRRSLAHDFRYFSIAAFVLFGLTMAALFRSVRVFLGMLATCSAAVLFTLLLQSWFGQKIAILTVNLGSIVFIIALSHLVYMTFNWQTLAGCMGKESPDLATAAVRMTFPASFWSLVCGVAGVCQFVNCASQATPGIGIRRRDRDGRGVRLRIRDVSAVFALGRAAQDQTHGERTSPRILVAPVRAAVARYDFARRRSGIWSDPNKHRSQSSRLFQTASGTA
jgi:predicted RND superfamily exporter protein